MKGIGEMRRIISSQDKKQVKAIHVACKERKSILKLCLSKKYTKYMWLFEYEKKKKWQKLYDTGIISACSEFLLKATCNTDHLKHQCNMQRESLRKN